MNYRHVYHVGNFADVVKHAVVARIVAYLKRKENAFRVLDTHAGAGVYDLASAQAGKTGEWRRGIARLADAALSAKAAPLIADYLDAVRALNPRGGLRYYPGSPALVRSLLRRQDRLTAVELHPEDAAALRSHFAGDHQVRVIGLDGWLSLGAHLPPKERRGLVLVDPPFEEPGEFERMADGLWKAYRRWPGGVYAFWYPVKERAAVARFRRRLATLEIATILDLEFGIRAPSPGAALGACGMAIVNPPYVLEAEMRTMLPMLVEILGEDEHAGFSVEWLAAESA